MRAYLFHSYPNRSGEPARSSVCRIRRLSGGLAFDTGRLPVLEGEPTPKKHPMVAVAGAVRLRGGLQKWRLQSSNTCKRNNRAGVPEPFGYRNPKSLFLALNYSFWKVSFRHLFEQVLPSTVPQLEPRR